MTSAERLDYYRSRGWDTRLSVDRLPTTAPRDYPMRAIPLQDPRFQSVYAAVLAAPRVRGALPPPATLSDFADRLRMGETYVIQKGEVTETCHKCTGAGRIPDTSKALRVGDGKIACPDCTGLGKLTRILQLLIKW